MKQSEANKGKNKKVKRTKASPGTGFAFARILSGRGTVVGEKLKTGVSAASVTKFLIYATLSLFLIIIRSTFFARFRPFGASPDILIVAVAVIGFFEGAYAGAIFGVSVGFIADSLGGVGVVLLPLLYMLVGYLCGVVATDYYRRSWILFLIFDAVSAAVRMFATLLYIMLEWHAFDLFTVFNTVLWPEFLSTLVISPLPALLLMPVYMIFRKKKKKKELD